MASLLETGVGGSIECADCVFSVVGGDCLMVCAQWAVIILPNVWRWDRNIQDNPGGRMGEKRWKDIV